MSSLTSVDGRLLGGEFIRFATLGILNVGILLIFYATLRSIFPEFGEAAEAALAWFIAYIASTIIAHALHRRYTFASDAPYIRSLAVALTVYSATLFASTLAMYLLVDIWNVDDLLTALVLNPVTGLFNFLALRMFAFELGFVPHKQPE